MHLDFIAEAREHRRAATRAEEPPGIIARLARDRHRVLREDRRCVIQRAMMLAAVEAMAQADSIRAPRCLYSHVATQASAGNAAHPQSPSPSFPRKCKRRNTAFDIVDQQRTCGRRCRSLRTGGAGATPAAEPDRGRLATEIDPA